MPLETASYISQLVPTNPVHTDGLSQADSHLRLLKNVLQTQFPSLGAAPLNISAAQVNALAASMNLGQSLCPTGMMAPFAGVTSDPNWLRCNGGTFAFATYPALGTFLGYVSGTCTLPNLEDTGRFVRSVTTGLAVRTSQANQNAAHTHTGSVGTALSVSGTVSGTTSGQSLDHSHNFSWSGTTSGQSAQHTHDQIASASVGSYSGGGSNGPLGSHSQTGVNSVDHTHTYSGSSTTGGTNSNHTHDFSWTGTLNGNLASGAFTTASSGGTEARPESYAAIWYIHI